MKKLAIGLVKKMVKKLLADGKNVEIDDEFDFWLAEAILEKTMHFPLTK